MLWKYTMKYMEYSLFVLAKLDCIDYIYLILWIVLLLNCLFFNRVLKYAGNCNILDS